MKKNALILFFLAFGFNLMSQPTAITWQGKLLDAGGNTITQNNVAMTFAMFDASSGGNQLWPATGVVTKTVNVVQGLYSVQLGTGVGDDIAFTAAMFNGKTPWLEVKVSTETLPRTEITNVPFVLISNELSASGWEKPGEIGKTTPNTGKFTSVETGSVKITDGAGDGKILKSGSDGSGSWETLSGLETDPVYNASLAANISASDTTRWGLKYWDKKGNDLFYAGGKIGIGNDDPNSLLKAPLNVEGGIRYSGGINGAGYAGQLYYDQADTGTFKYVDNLGRHKVFGAGSINYSGTLWSLSGSDLYTNRDVICGYALGVGRGLTGATTFGFTTILVKEDNIRITLDDNSVTTGFPANDWQITINDASSGGTNYFAIDDLTNSKTPFKIMASAPASSIFVSPAGLIGSGTSSPEKKLHLTNGDTPCIRLEQDISQGWMAQKWDIGANDANFFIRDVTSGSTYPFRIKPGAPHNSLTISNNGNVGIGTGTPQQKLHVTGIMRLEPSDEPATAGEGDIYYDKNTHKARCYDGTTWRDLW